ncbi:MAG: ASCH domain-containing protein [Desulfurococcales archaeon]|nr:ASCH domain-containing protein [Desulfurococcales archaeon]
MSGRCLGRLDFGGLKIKEKFIEYILDGRKTWEIRKSFGVQARKYLNIPILLLPICDKRTKDCNPRIVMSVVKIIDYKYVSFEEALKLVNYKRRGKKFLLNNYGKKTMYMHLN